MTEFYIYEYIRLDTNEVFYVGKGSGRRWNYLAKRNNYFTNIINSVPYKVIKVLENLSESDAFEAEISFIKYRKSIGQASCNFTTGGDGRSGHKISNDHREKINLKLKKKVINTVTGQEFESVNEAALSIGMKRTTLSMMLIGRNPNKTSLVFKEI